ncbi:MAG: hypothetical protein FJX59_20330 [Alphaproteobacteria bacterium]|nr:hypothetical protein [Alphaproteobacteria bacterium]
MSDKSSAARTPSRRAKGAQPHFFDDPNIDRLMTMIMNMAAEISVLRERLDTHEQVAAQKGAFTPTDLEAYQPTDAVADAREAWRKKFIERLLKPVEQDYDRGLD